jgi:hypothetical protein
VADLDLRPESSGPAGQDIRRSPPGSVVRSVPSVNMTLSGRFWPTVTARYVPSALEKAPYQPSPLTISTARMNSLPLPLSSSLHTYLSWIASSTSDCAAQSRTTCVWLIVRS